jgi:hypothetical protein
VKRSKLTWLAGGILTAVVLWPASAFAGNGNSDAAHDCQHGGYSQYVAPDGGSFKNTGECVSFVAHGGVLVTPTPPPTPTPTPPSGRSL